MSSAPAEEAVRFLAERSLTLATAESCTGGLVAAAITAVPGASAVFQAGFVTYANIAKTRFVGVGPDLIRDFGAVSAHVARAMAEGARAAAHADLALSVTGIAGPSGGSEAKPVGLVYLACAGAGETRVLEKRFGPLGRDAIRALSVEAALGLLLDMVSSDPQSVPPEIGAA